MIRSYRDLVVWQKSMDLAVEIYQLSRKLPVEERFGLAAQIRRAVVAVAANLAEGHERRSRADFRRFVSIARGSLAEVETHLELSHRMGYAAKATAERVGSLAGEVGRMLSGLYLRLAR
jgi:four helix bundle protein